MRAVIQRVKDAKLFIEEKIYSSIELGLIILVAFEETDTTEDLDYIAKKVSKLRIFDDSEGVMNLSIEDIMGEIMVVSQFTLYASTKKGNRPSYIKAAKPDIAVPLYNSFIDLLNISTSAKISTGVFGADMKVSFTNFGPVTIIIDSKLKE